MSRRAPLVALLCLVVALCGAPAAHAIDAGTLQKRLSTYGKKLGSSSGAYVVDVDAGTQLFARNPDVKLAPASNEKLFTTATALLKFGTTATIPTSVEAKQAIDEDGRLEGDLYLVGGGDPSLGDRGLGALASALKTAGLKKVSGGVRGDGTAFDALRGSFDSGYRADGDIGGQLGGLTWGHGSAHPGGPTAVAARRVQKLLSARGVKFGSKARAASSGAGEDAETLATTTSPTMLALVTATNVPSDNFYAETLVKLLGRKFGGGLGTTESGLGVMRDTLGDLGVSPTLRDGSGLSRADRTSPKQLVTLLRQMNASKVASAFRSSLPVPGKSGTLRSRMRGTAARRCQAKTGTLRGVSALSGYCLAANGHTLIFSFVENAVYAPGAKSIEDRMLPSVAAYSG